MSANIFLVLRSRKKSQISRANRMTILFKPVSPLTPHTIVDSCGFMRLKMGFVVFVTAWTVMSRRPGANLCITAVSDKFSHWKLAKTGFSGCVKENILYISSCHPPIHQSVSHANFSFLTFFWRDLQNNIYQFFRINMILHESFRSEHKWHPVLAMLANDNIDLHYHNTFNLLSKDKLDVKSLVCKPLNLCVLCDSEN